MISVIVVVAKGSAGAPTPKIANARLGSDVGESSIPVVPVQHRAIEISNVEVFVAIVVVVACCGAESPAAMVDSRFRRDVGERAVVIVAIELAGVTLARFHIFECGSVHQEDVHPAVIVVVEDRDAAAQRFHDVTLFRAPANEVEINSGREGYIGKRYAPQRSSLPRTR